MIRQLLPEHGGRKETNTRNSIARIGSIMVALGATGTKGVVDKTATTPAPALRFVSDWAPIDYNEVDGVAEHIDYGSKNYFYDSPLALDGTLYNVGQHGGACLFPADTTYYPNGGRYQLRRSDTGVDGTTHAHAVPGPFPYEWQMHQWAGDSRLNMGPHFYSGLMQHMGYAHICAIQAKVYVLRANPHADVGPQNSMLAHLKHASTEIFKRFGGLTLPTGMPSSPPAGPVAARLQALMRMMIDGTSTPDGAGAPDPHTFLDSMDNMASALGNNDPQLIESVAKLRNFWTYILRLDHEPSGHNAPLPLLSWQHLLTQYQYCMSNGYQLYADYYARAHAPLSLPPEDEARRALSEGAQKGIDGGRQMAAFFGGFYSIISFLDILLGLKYTGAEPSVREPAIPDTIVHISPPSPDTTTVRNARVDWVYFGQSSYWAQHVTMFNDFGKAAARGDDTTLFKVTVNMLESFSVLAIQLGEIMRAMDELVRRRRLFDLIG